MARFRLPFLAGLIASFALPSRADLHAQHVWTRADSSPDARIEHALAFDGARGVVVMHGGRSLDGLLADTWEWDGNNWTQVPTRSGPAALSGHALGYDPLSRRLLLVNGTRTTWIWSGADWTAQSTSSVSGTGGRMSFEWTGSDWKQDRQRAGLGALCLRSQPQRARARNACWALRMDRQRSAHQGYRAVWDAKRSEVLVTGGERYAIPRDCPLHLRHPQRQARRAPRDGSLARARCRELLRWLPGRARGLRGCTVASPSRPLKKSREAQSSGFGVPLASRTAGESADSSRIRDVDGASKTLL
jgi:hypothetical protein